MNYLLDGSSSSITYKKFVANTLFNNKILVKRIMNNINLKNEYIKTLCNLKNKFNTNSLFTKITSLKTLIQADVLLDTKKPYTNSQFLGNIETTSFTDFSLPNAVPGIKQFINDRSLALTAFLNSISFNCTLGVKEIRQRIELSIYPNPANNFLYIKTNLEDKKYLKIRVLNLLGQEMIYQSYSEKINISMLNQGVYVIELHDISSSISVGKFIKQ
jgi:hypothetical protein